jgi:hypothetical protein
MRNVILFHITVNIASSAIPIYGGMKDFGYYFVDISLGTPSQRMGVIIDTGSDGLSVTCAACSSCGSMHMDPFYNPQISRTFAQLDECPAVHLRSPTCTFEKRYLEGSLLRGRMISDQVALGTSDLIKKIPLGCIETETKLFLEQKANGILGLAPSKSNHFLYDENPNIQAFSICLSTIGGEMKLHASLDQPIDAIGLEYRDNHYVVEPRILTILDVSGKTKWSTVSQNEPLVRFTGTKTLVDSGSTITYLTDKLFALFLKEIKEAISDLQLIEDLSGPSLCWIHSSDIDISTKLPRLEFTFSKTDESGNVKTLLKDYISRDPQSDGKTKTCLTVASNNKLDRTDLGASWLNDKEVIFTSSAGWMSIQEKVCPKHPIETRSPVVAIDGQVVTNTPGVAGWAMVGVIATFALILVFIVRRNISDRSPIHTTASE